MREVYVISYEHIDFWVETATRASELVDEGLLPCTEAEAAVVFREAGWEGDGTIGYVWLPPFLFEDYTLGRGVWHVKQRNNGTSWLCCGFPLEAVGLSRWSNRWRKFSLPVETAPGERTFSEQLNEELDAYLEGGQTMSDFYRWFVPATWDIHLNESPEVVERVKEIQYLIDESSRLMREQLQRLLPAGSKVKSTP